MLRRTWIWTAAVVLILANVVCSCKPADRLASEINMNHGPEPPTIDPNLGTDIVSIQCTELLFMGLTTFDLTTMEAKPWLATQWKVSPDGLAWTFSMRKDVFWVYHDPATGKTEKKRPVTADDIVYSVRRAANPSTASDYAYVDYIIRNFEAVNTGELSDLEAVGVKALDQYTVEFTLKQPAGYFAGIAGMWTNNPVPREPIEQFGERWTEPGNIWTCGAYVLDVWEHENRMVMNKNPFWFDAKNVSIEQVNFAMVVQDSTAFAMYEAGELDVQTVPLTDIDRVKADPVLSKELNMAPMLRCQYLGFNVTKPPFDNVKVRQAFSYAIDRQKLIDTVMKAGQRPAECFAPRGIFGSPEDAPKFEGISFDPQKARALLAEAGYPDGKGLPEITYMLNTNEGNQRIAEFVQAGWKEHLGVDVKLANQEWKVYINTVNTDSPQVWRMSWGADYPDENNWVLENFHTKLSLNNAKWSGPDAEEFDRLVEEAASSVDPANRKELYFKAEKILCADSAVIMPLYFSTNMICTKPYVERTFASLTGEQIYYWKVKAH